jgi:hypothetical protein
LKEDERRKLLVEDVKGGLLVEESEGQKGKAEQMKPQTL